MNGEPLGRAEFYRAIDGLTEQLRVGIGDITKRLDTMNGRVGTSEQKIAVLQDRSETDQEERREERREERWRSLLIGSGGGAGVYGAIQLFKLWISK